MYLTEIHLFQRHITTDAFRIAGGVDLSSTRSKPLKQHTIGSDFLAKITKAVLDSLGAFLDGLVYLTSDDAPINIGKQFSVVDVSTMTGTNPLELLDLSEPVRFCCLSIVMCFSSSGYPNIVGHCKFRSLVTIPHI
jgi:exocyst complex component 2